MSRIAKAPEGGNFRARAATALDATDGTWGGGDLLCVKVDGSGELIVATALECDGVIWLPESRTHASQTLANFQQAIGGKVYTVFTWAEIQEMTNVAVGDKVYAGAAGVVTIGTGATSTADAVFLGIVLPDDTVPGGAGIRMVLNVGAAPAALGV